MPRKKCGFGFNCAAMMLQPGLEPKDCENFEICAQGSTPLEGEEEEVELIRKPLE